MDRDITREQYLATLDPKKMTIGILFASSLWIYDNLDAVDALVREIERRGMNALPVFYQAVSYKNGDEWGTRKTMETYFTENGRCLADAILIHTQFSVMYNSREDMGVRIQDSDNYYSTLLLDFVYVVQLFPSEEFHRDGLGRHVV